VGLDGSISFKQIWCLLSGGGDSWLIPIIFSRDISLSLSLSLFRNLAVKPLHLFLYLSVTLCLFCFSFLPFPANIARLKRQSVNLTDRAFIQQ
ncbi:unnamed protein product, partial [Prunus brigantina]